MSTLDSTATPLLQQLRGANDELIQKILGRDEIRVESEGPRELVNGRRVLVTGAGGSIGSELCRQIARLEPSALLMLDRDESALHAIKLGMTGNATMDTPDLVLADLRDRARMANVFRDTQPEVVFHAAALKHVPLLERNPTEAWKTNVVGSLNVLQLAAMNNVQTLVNISTDKAANAENVLGLSKRLAERLTAAVAREKGLNYLSVRFGNVLGTRGSLLETFMAQIDAGGPITVTDAKVTRYFMTVQEAVRLVLEAGSQKAPGACMVLDMGEPMSIDSLAQQLISWSGKDIPIAYSGLRAGEKLFESLFDDSETPEASKHPSISTVSVPPVPVEIINNADPNREDLEMRAMLARLASYTL